MNREDWIYSSSCLRGLLRNLAEGDFQRRIKYRFGMQFNPMFGFYNLWDGVQKRTIATVRLRPKSFIMRYDDESIFSNEMCKFTLPDRRAILIPSVNITRNDVWVGQRLQSRVERKIKDREAFLDNQRFLSSDQGRYSLTVRLVSPRILRGRLGMSLNTPMEMEEVVYRVTVTFNTEQELALRGTEAQQMVERLVRQYGVTFTSDRITFSALVATFHQAQERTRIERLTREREERMMREYASTTSLEQYRDYFMGRPMEQIQEVMNSQMNTEGRALTTEDLMNAVNRMDEANTPRERGTGGRALDQFLQEYPNPTTASEYGQAINIPRIEEREARDV